jgi:type I pantothenate kinase
LFLLREEKRVINDCSGQHVSLYSEFSREQWQRYKEDKVLTLTALDVDRLRGVNEPVSLLDVTEVYLPLARLLHLSYAQIAEQNRLRCSFLQQPQKRTPYVIGIAGSVAVGKSTTARLLQALLSSWQDCSVELVTTDGFLMSTAELEKKGLMEKKGFPESYHLDQLIQFLYHLKSGYTPLSVPVYSHQLYDVVPDLRQPIDNPDILIIEGLNILQTGGVVEQGRSHVFVSDFIDFSIFVNSDEPLIKKWFVDRILKFCEGPFKDPAAYFHYLSQMREAEVRDVADQTWETINGLNLRENILPFKNRADLIINKASHHAVTSIQLKK